MKKKFTKILGVGLTLVLLASLMSFAIPASAAPLTWTSETPPSTTSNILAPSGYDQDINDLAVNGDTMYAATNYYQSGEGGLYKSTDGGATWTNMQTTTAYPTTSDIKFVSVSPDDPDMVAMATATTVYYSENGGSLWSNLGVPTEGSVSTSAIYDIDMSAAASNTYYIAVGGDNGSTGGELFTLKLATAENWQQRSLDNDAPSSGNFTPQEAVMAVKFSPNFATDKIITLITGDVTSGAASYFQVFRYESGAYTWNNGITYYTGDGYANGVLLDTLTAAATKADITLSPDYLGTEEQERIGFASLAAGTSDGGAYRANDAYVKELTTWSGGDEGPIYSVAYHEDGKLLAGDSDENQVYRCLDPLATAPKFERLASYKQPGGANSVVVAWSDDDAVAATSGDESAFAISTDDGEAFNDISLIDTTLATITDVGVSADGSMTYLASYSGNDVSVWLREDSTWMRILSIRDASYTTGIIRVAPEDGEVVYVGFKNSQDIYVTKNAGKESWKYVPCYKISSLLDFTVEDEDVAYALDTAGVSKTTNSGASWGSKKPMDGLAGFMITLAPNGDVLVGGTDGKVAFSTDGGSSFTSTEKQAGGASGCVIVVADADYDSNNIIYAANQAKTTIYRATASKTTKFDDRGPALGTGYYVTGMVEADGIIYAVSTNNSDGSKLWRALGPLAIADDSGMAGWSGRSTSSLFNASPQALKFSEGPKFWAVTTSDLLSMTDPIAVEGPVLNSPADAASIPVNPQTGRAYTITFSFDRYHNKDVTGLEMEISTDSGFTGVITSIGDISTHKDTMSITVGPNADYAAEYMPGYTYYWRMRINEVGGDTMKSPWSEVRSFTVESLGADVIMLEAPTAGATGVSLTPSFSWTAVEGAVSYKFQIAKDADFTVPGWSKSGLANPVYLAEHELEYDTTYFWRAQAVLQAKPEVTSEWTSGTFTTMSEPVTPTATATPTPTSAEPIVIPPSIPTALLWAIVAIGAVLFIALIILIVRTRRVV